ncbi:MAG TPA: hypothetical protein VEL03_12205 [Streptosporangiaceae bacterium]|nr:hypothetical protein [Streptosporangiaceae bacterium]
MTPDDEYPDFLWPDEDEERDDAQNGPDSLRRGAPTMPAYEPPASGRKRSVLALAGTAVLACGLGAGAVLIYRQVQSASAPTAPVSQGTGSQGAAPGQSGGPAGQGSFTQVEMIGRVTAVGTGTITLGGGPAQPVQAAVTSATRFTGSVRTLAGVRVGDVVAAQIKIVNGVGKVVSLQDPASES